MGGCCANSSNNRNETNLMFMVKDGNMKPGTLATIIKAQARMRGLLTRKRIMKKYGF